MVTSSWGWSGRGWKFRRWGNQWFLEFGKAWWCRCVQRIKRLVISSWRYTGDGRKMLVLQWWKYGLRERYCNPCIIHFHLPGIHILRQRILLLGDGVQPHGGDLHTLDRDNQGNISQRMLPGFMWQKFSLLWRSHTCLESFHGPKTIVHTGKMPYAEVSGGELWINILHKSLKHGLASKSWTDYLHLTERGRDGSRTDLH